jgi:Cof subfamily protein (haloacid dehalogenase superfamily)
MAVQNQEKVSAQSSTKKMPGKFKMVALDLDGTLLNSKHQLSGNTIAYLRDLHEKGLIVCIATGRSAFACGQVIQDLDLKYPNAHTKGFPLVCFNGAKGLSVEKGDVVGAIANPSSNPMIDGRLTTCKIFHNHVNQELTVKTLEFAKSIGCVVNYYIDHDIYAQPTLDWHHDATQKYIDLTGVTYSFCDDDYKQAMSIGLPSKLLILCGEENVDDVHQKTAEHLQDEATVIRGSPPFFVEILRNDVCKGDGLERMCDSLGVSLDEVISFGDGFNDIEFIQNSGLGYAMKNAADAVKAIADDVTEHCNNEDGVVKTLKVLEESGKLAFTNKEK